MQKKIVFIAHQIAAVKPKDPMDEEAQICHNIELIKIIVGKINIKTKNIIPFVPYLSDVVSLDETDREHRARGLSNCLEVIQRGGFDELWLTGPRISEGMSAEAMMAASVDKPVINLINVDLLAYLQNLNY